MKGIYILVISVDADESIKVGALGKISFEKGIYLYVGSAQNNLEKRIQRHMRKDKTKRWHIDYFLNIGKIDGVYYMQAPKEEECRTAGILQEKHLPIKGFGCSDCKCNGHLFKAVHNLELKKHGFKIYEPANKVV